MRACASVCVFVVLLVARACAQTNVGTTSVVPAATTAAPVTFNITSITPSTGTTSGGFTVTLEGTGLSSLTAVTVKSGKTSGSSTTFPWTAVVTASASSGKVTFVMPPGGGMAQVWASSGGSSVYVNFMYSAATLTSVKPTLVPLSKAASVTLTGTNLGNSTTFPLTFSATVGGQAATVSSMSSWTTVVLSVASMSSSGAKTITASYGGTSISNSLSINVQKESVPVQVTVPGTVETFDQTAFVNKLFTALKLNSADQVRIIEIKAGSVIVIFAVLSSPAQPDAADTAEQRVQDAAADGSLNDIGVSAVKIGDKDITVEDGEDDGLSAGAIAGAVIGGVFGFLVIVLLVVVFWKHRKQSQRAGTPGQQLEQPSLQTPGADVGVV